MQRANAREARVVQKDEHLRMTSTECGSTHHTSELCMPVACHGDGVVEGVSAHQSIRVRGEV